jgi:hypothetical protein
MAACGGRFEDVTLEPEDAGSSDAESPAREGGLDAGGANAGEDATVDAAQDAALDARAPDAARDAAALDAAADANGGDGGPPDAGSVAWLSQIGGGEFDAVAVNAQGQVLVSGVAGFGANYYYYVQKFDALGGPIWKKQRGPSTPRSVALDATGNAYLGGWTSTTEDFGGGPVGPGAFLVKLNPQGNFVWQRGANGQFLSMAIRANGNLVVGGVLNGPTDFGGGTLTPDGPDALLLELTATNQFVRAKTFTGGTAGSSQSIGHLTLGASDEVVIDGNFESGISLGGATFSGPPAGSGGTNGFVAKLGPTFDHLASIDLKAQTNLFYLGPVGTDSAGNVFVGGGFDSTVDLGGGTLVCAGGRDIFLGKLDPSLAHVWSKRIGDANDQLLTTLAMDAEGNLGIAGQYNGNLNLGCGAFPNVTPPAKEMFVARIATTGACVDSIPISGGNPLPLASAYAGGTDFVFVGVYWGSVSFPSGTLSVMPPIQNDGFIAHMTP